MSKETDQKESTPTSQSQVSQLKVSQLQASQPQESQLCSKCKCKLSCSKQNQDRINELSKALESKFKGYSEELKEAFRYDPNIFCRGYSEALCYMVVKPDPINCVKIITLGSLSKNGRVKVEYLESFDSIEISCDPKEIECVTLYLNVSTQNHLVYRHIPEEYKDIISSSPIYIPVKTIYKPETSTIRFFNSPISLLSAREMFSIQVKTKSRMTYDQTSVKLNYFIADFKLRERMMDIESSNC